MSKLEKNAYFKQMPILRTFRNPTFWTA